MNYFGWLFAAVGALALAGCVGVPVLDGGGAVSEQPVSQQAVKDDATTGRAKVHTELGALYMQDGRMGVALDEARIAIAADPGYAPAHNLLGLVHMFLQENKAADEAFRRALGLAPGDPEINNNYGWFLCQTGRPADSIAYFRNAVRNPYYTTPAKPNTNAGICLIRAKDDKGAEEFLRQALRADPANQQALWWLADIQYRGNRLHEARARLVDLHKLIEPSAESSWLGLRIERKLGDREGEARFAAQLRRRFQGTPEFQKLMQGQYE